jgi:TPR repeat protein
MRIKSYNLILTVSLLTLVGASLCQASDLSGKDKEPAAVESQKRPALTAAQLSERINKLTPQHPALLHLATQGNLEAMNRLGVCFKGGKGCPPNLGQAFYWFQQAAQLNHPAALINYAGALFAGDGCERSASNDKLALSCVKKAGELGRLEGTFFYADCLLNGKGCERTIANQTLAWKIFNELADKGHDESLFRIGCCLLDNPKSPDSHLKEGVRLLKQAAKLGHAKSLNRLGSCFLMGTGCYRDNDEAFKCFKEAAEKGFEPALQSLSTCLQNGTGCAKTLENQELAIKTFETLAKKGDVNSMLCLADTFDAGNGTQKDPKKARYWYETAAKSGQPLLIYSLALFYFNNSEFDLAIPCFETIKKHYRVGEFLGYLYFRQKNYQQALAHYEDANVNGSEDNVNAGTLQVTKAKNINPKLLTYLRNKVQEATAISEPLPKAERTNVVKTMALAAQEGQLATLQSDVESFYARLVKQLEETAVNDEIDAGKELDTLHKTYSTGTADLESLDTVKRIARLKVLTQCMCTLEARLLAYEQKMATQQKISALREQALRLKQNPQREEVETARDRNVTKETKSAAVQALSAVKSLKHKKAMRKHEPMPKGKIIAKVSSQPAAEPEKAKGPFSDMKKPIKRLKANITDAGWRKVYQIRDALRDAQSMDEAIGILSSLEGDFSFTDVETAYAGVPNNCKAYEMRINDQYRVIIAFQPETVKVYEDGPNGEHNNNPVEKTAYKLYGDTIYIDDPHIKG